MYKALEMTEESTVIADAERVPEFNREFYHDVVHGLSQRQKSIPCKWFYDEAGSLLFEAITKTAEYYPTRVETRLLQEVVKEISNFIPDLSLVIEPGSGASVKTRILLSSQANLKTYMPIDISAEFLNETVQQLQQSYPNIKILPLVDDFTNMRNPIDIDVATVRMIFFPGSTIGNFTPEEAQALLKNFHQLAGKAGWLLIGVDSTQNEKQLLAAYNDKAGITAQFNKNLLLRANRELQANFQVEQFLHEARFNRAEGKVEMHLVSSCKQTVVIGPHEFKFMKGESIFTENCYKYTRQRFLSYAKQCNWHMEHVWQDYEESAFELFLLKSAD
ncbi:MAG TPA: L-histidine N(alpha)-methyltransferase [Methylotenera sp.]|nr:L-histidine N(alpha)-methyltransferase [Methylotenera sp.]